jgi:hypothetical protein
MKIDNPVLLGQSSGFGIPSAGTSGQVLRKVDGTNYNTQWADNGSPATYIYAFNGGGQTIPTGGSGLVITNWSNSIAINASEWNPTTGVFTATKAGTYIVTINLTYASIIDNVNAEYSANINKNGGNVGQSRIFVQVTQIAPSFKQPNVGTGIVSLVPGDTITFSAVQFTGGDRYLHSNGNALSIQELPTRVVR